MILNNRKNAMLSSYESQRAIAPFGEDGKAPILYVGEIRCNCEGKKGRGGRKSLLLALNMMSVGGGEYVRAPSISERGKPSEVKEGIRAYGE